MSARKRREKKRKKNQQKPLKPSQSPVPDFASYPTLDFRSSPAMPAGVVKMSEVLEDFLDPYWDTWKTEEDLRKLVLVGVVAWNAAIVSGKPGESLIREVLNSVPPDLRSDLRMMLDDLILRKEKHFADNKRLILNYQVKSSPSGPSLVVASTL
jgi:hypothetical protein